MRMLLSLALTSALVQAQPNFVNNGDFVSGLTGWTQTGYSVAPGLESFDTSGLGASQCFGCHPGGQVSPPPYPPNVLETTVLVLAGPPLEFTADIAVLGQNGNADAGTFWVEVAGVEVGRVALGTFVAGATQRARLTARFVATTPGMQPLRLNFHRNYTCHTGTPRARIDNVSLRLAPGPTFLLHGNRRIATTLQLEVRGNPSDAFLILAAAGRSTGLQIPGIGGVLYLDLGTTSTLISNSLDPLGVFALNLPIPYEPYLTFAPVWVQVLAAGASTGLYLGHEQFLTFVP